MKTLLFVVAIGWLGLPSCATTHPYAMSGTFQGKFLGMQRFEPGLMKLHLSEDSTFNIQAYYWSGYTGKWVYNADSSITLVYNPPKEGEAPEFLLTPSWDKSDHIIKIINKNKLQYDERTKLKRVRNK
ncbi:MAG: hypothetical protein ACLR8Y_10100 [Alistipes indistinctus]